MCCGAERGRSCWCYCWCRGWHYRRRRGWHYRRRIAIRKAIATGAVTTVDGLQIVAIVMINVGVVPPVAVVVQPSRRAATTAVGHHTTSGRRRGWRIAIRKASASCAVTAVRGLQIVTVVVMRVDVVPPVAVVGVT
jgi:hypothetical protein